MRAVAKIYSKMDVPKAVRRIDVEVESLDSDQYIIIGVVNEEDCKKLLREKEAFQMITSVDDKG